MSERRRPRAGRLLASVLAVLLLGCGGASSREEGRARPPRAAAIRGVEPRLPLALTSAPFFSRACTNF